MERRPRAALDPEVKAALKRLTIGIVVLSVLVIVVGLIIKGPLEEAGGSLVRRFGYFGLAVGIFAADSGIIPVPPDLYLLVAVAGDAPAAWVLVTASAASIAGGMTAYHIGRALTRLGWIGRKVARINESNHALVERLGIGAVIVAALTPVPYSVVCMAAGSFRIRVPSFLAASLCRIPRMAAFYGLIALGWHL
jgi:membrane protein YqaA with SNARE-associated domain